MPVKALIEKQKEIVSDWGNRKKFGTTDNDDNEKKRKKSLENLLTELVASLSAGQGGLVVDEKPQIGNLTGISQSLEDGGANLLHPHVSDFLKENLVSEDQKSPFFTADGDALGHMVLATRFSSGINLLKTFIGAGIISLPLAMASFGLLTGTILIILAGLTALLGLYFYIDCASRVGGRDVTPHSIAMLTRPWLGHMWSFSVFLKILGVGLTYLLLIGNIMSTMMLGFFDESSIWTTPRIWISIFVVFIVGPLSFLRRLDHLKYSSSLGLISVAYLLSLSIYSFFANDISRETLSAVHLVAPFSYKTLSRFGIFLFAFTCHQNILPLYNETKLNSVRSMVLLCSICVSISTVVYVMYGVFSYLAYADVLTNGSMFTYYPRNQITYQIARLLFALLLAFSYPLQVVPFRLASRLLFLKQGSKETTWLYLASTSFILSFTFGISMLLPDLSNVLSLVGSIASSVICFIIPSLFYITLHKKSSLRQKKMYLAYLLLGLGLFVFVVCSTVSIINFFI